MASFIYKVKLTIQNQKVSFSNFMHMCGLLITPAFILLLIMIIYYKFMCANTAIGFLQQNNFVNTIWQIDRFWQK